MLTGRKSRIFYHVNGNLAYQQAVEVKRKINQTKPFAFCFFLERIKQKGYQSAMLTYQRTTSKLDGFCL